MSQLLIVEWPAIRAETDGVRPAAGCRSPKVAVNGVGPENAPARAWPIPLGESHDERSYAVIGAAMEVHREVGCGFLERVYPEALALELKLRGIPYKREVRFAITYKARLLPVTSAVDFVCHDSLIVEVKALPAIGPPERAATELPSGIGSDARPPAQLRCDQPPDASVRMRPTWQFATATRRRRRSRRRAQRRHHVSMNTD